MKSHKWPCSWGNWAKCMGKRSVQKAEGALVKQEDHQKVRSGAQGPVLGAASSVRWAFKKI